MKTKLVGKRIENEEIKRIELGILQDVLNYCFENNLRVFAAYGTLLGAVRHKGFIPWDDDIDLFMPRKDYAFFVENYSGKSYDLISNKNNKKYPFLFSKVFCKGTVVIEPNIKKKYAKTYGVYIDIFPLDVSPVDQKGFIKLTKSLQLDFDLLGIKYKKRLTRANIFKTFLSDLAFVFLLLTPLSFFHNAIERKIVNCSKNIGEYVSNFTIGTYIRKDRYHLDDFSNTLMVPFENISIPIPRGYDRVLKTIYGDYMVLPPVEKRVNAHGLIAYFLEEKSL